MIIYTTQQHTLLSTILLTVRNQQAYYYQTGRLEVSRVNQILPSMIAKYDLKSSENDRANQLRQGLPTYTLIINFHPKDIGHVSFYLFTTGYRPSLRASQEIKENWQALNLKLMRQRSFKSIITQNPNDLLKIGDFVLGQYIHFPELVAGNDYQYLFPETYGVLIDPRTFDSDAERLSIEAMSHVKDAKTIQLGAELTPQEADKFKQAHERFADVFFKDQQKHQYKTHTQLKALLRKQHGIIIEDDETYNNTLKRYRKVMDRVSNRYLGILQRKAKKIVRFTWYLNDAYSQHAHNDIDHNLKHIVQHPDRTVEAIQRLFWRGNFRGARVQIGQISSFYKSRIKERYPNIYKKMKFPTTLRYIRFLPNEYTNFKQFHMACIDLYITQQERQIKREEQDIKYRKLRLMARKEYAHLKTADTNELNQLIRSADPDLVDGKIVITVTDILRQELYDEYPFMNPMYISDTF